MKMSNKTYDALKKLALIVLPGVATLYFTIAGIWGLPYGEEVGATISAIVTFLGIILDISNTQYKKITPTNKEEV